MNPDVKTKWVAALRSGEFEQGRNRLNDGGNFCCLGVLCELAVAEGVIVKEPRHLASGQETAVVLYDGRSTQPSVKVMDWAGLTQADPEVGRTTLMGMNDEAMAPFTEIADAIDEYL